MLRYSSSMLEKLLDMAQTEDPLSNIAQLFVCCECLSEVRGRLHSIIDEILPDVDVSDLPAYTSQCAQVPILPFLEIFAGRGDLLT